MKPVFYIPDGVREKCKRQEMQPGEQVVFCQDVPDNIPSATARRKLEKGLLICQKSKRQATTLGGLYAST